MQDAQAQGSTAPSSAASGGTAGSVALTDLEAPFAWIAHGSAAGGATPPAAATDTMATLGAAFLFAAVAIAYAVRRIATASARSGGWTSERGARDGSAPAHDAGLKDGLGRAAFVQRSAGEL